MAQFMISLAAVLVLAALAWGAAVLFLGRDPGLEPAEPDGQAVPLPSARPLTEADLDQVRFDTVPRGYRMQQVDQALHRAAYDIGYKEELIGVLEAELAALREGRLDEAEALRQARDNAARPGTERQAEVEDVAEVEPTLGQSPTIGAGPSIGVLPEGAGLAEDSGLVGAGDAEGSAGVAPAGVAPEPDDSTDDDLATATVRTRAARSDGPGSEGRPANGEK